MPSFFSRKKPTAPTTASSQPAAEARNSVASDRQSQEKSSTGTGTGHPSGLTSPPPPPHRSGLKSPSSTTSTPVSSPEKSPDKAKTSKGYFGKEREREKRPNSPRTSKSYTRSGKKGAAEEEHPLNFHPDDPRRLSALSRLSGVSGGSGSPRQEKDREYRMAESEPMEQGTPAPETTPGAFPQTNGMNGEKNGGEADERPVPPPHRTPTSSPEDAEAFKASGNKYYKAQQYDRAIEEYTKGVSLSTRLEVKVVS